jgi:2',3'-cyclic-nucleotide 2'-phosphodiesterase/3'-nucleotidase
MSDYINLIHTLSLGCAPAQISFAAPLTYDGRVPAGKVLYNDLFTIYPYENQLFVIKMTGKEIKDALEYSYDRWINTYDPSNPHILRIRNASDPRTGQVGWSFVARSYNFDSAAGIIYEVDVTRKYGSRINIKSLADGTAFNEDETYNVALTSYRANGGGGILSEGAGIDTSNIGERVVARYPEIREMLYEFFMRHGQVDSKLISDPDVVGSWSFVPSGIADRMLADDIRLLFGDK